MARTSVVGPRVAFRIGPRVGPAVAPLDDEMARAVLLLVTVLPAEPSVGVLGTVQMTARGAYSDNTVRDITAAVVWSTVLGAIATVGALGLVAGVAVGSTQVRATLEGVMGQTTVTVTL
jgi:hypothetical protein